MNTLDRKIDTASSRRLIAAMLVVSLTIVIGMLAPIPSFGRLTEAIGDLVHAPMFGSLTVLILLTLDLLRPLSLQRRAAPLVRLGPVMIGVFAFGLLMELNQLMVGRHAALHDVIANSLGIIAAGLWYCSRMVVQRQPNLRMVSATMLVGAGTLLVIASWQPMMLLASAFERFSN